MDAFQTIFDPEGNAKVIVSSEEGTDETSGKVVFKVSSKVMKLFCEPWKAMLNPKNEFTKWINGAITFHGDNAKALSTLLHIAHLQFDEVPETVSIDDLLEIAILTDKYQATKMIRPFLSAWAGPLVGDAITGNSYHKFLWIAWEFGMEEIFEKILSRMVMECKTNSENEYLAANGQKLVEVMSVDVFEKVLEIRRDTIEKLLKAMQDLYDGLCVKSRTGGLCKSVYPQMRKQCGALMLGSLVAGLSSLQLLGKPISAKDFHGSIKDLESEFLKIELHTYPGYPHQSHCSCTLISDMRLCVQKTLKAIPSAISSQHRHHLAAQQEKTKTQIGKDRAVNDYTTAYKL